MKVWTNELDGTLLVMTEDERVYEVSRGSIGDYLHIRPDKLTPDASREEEIEFKRLFNLSGCYHR
jgi:hypothetical protein